MKKKIFAEIGFGNDTFLSTEIEIGKKESRIARFLTPKKIKGFYFRIWIKNKVLVVSTRTGISITVKSKKKFKFLFGIEGIE